MLGSVSVAVAQWLVDEAGCWIPAASDVSVMAGAFWYELQRRALLGPDATLKLRWFQERGAPPLEGEDHPHWLLCWADAAAWAGQVEVLRHLLLTLGPEQVAKHPWWFQAAMSEPVPVMECLREVGVRFTTLAYETAAPEGHLGVVRWLALEAGVRAKKLVLTGVVDQWPDRTPAHSRDLLEAVQLLVGEAGCNAWARLPEGFVLAFGSRDRFWNILARGDLALAQFVLGQRPGYRPDTANVKAVVLSGNEALLEWIVQRVDRVESLDGAQLYPLAAISGERSMLAALLRLGVPWGAEDVVVRAVRTGSCMTAVRWLVEEGAPVGSRKGMEKAMKGRGQRQKLGDEEKAWLRGLVAT